MIEEFYKKTLPSQGVYCVADIDPVTKKTNHKFVWIFNIILVLLIVLPVRFSFERLKLFSKNDRNPQWVIDLKEFNKRGIKQGILFNYPKPIEAMFYTDLTVYPNIPKKEVVNDLIGKGYTVLINDSENIPQDILELKGIRIGNLSTGNIDGKK